LIPDARRLSLDTNALIYYLEKREPYRGWLRPLFEDMQRGTREFVLSAIAYAEMRVKPLRERDATVLEMIEALMDADAITMAPVTRVVASGAAEIRARLGLELPDAIVVATALDSGCDALIGNDKTCARRVTEIPYIYLDEVVSA
jgi:predicted nucleic acid-binding protein